MEKHIAIVAARAGSKSIKDKNLLRLNEKTLVRIAVEKAMKSRIFSRIIISTDYPRHRLGIEDMGTEALTQVQVLKRPDSLCTDTAEMLDVLKNVLKTVGGAETYVWLIQPTSPFSTQEDFKKIFDVMTSQKLTSCVSEKPAHDYIDRIRTVKNSKTYRIPQNNFRNKQDVQDQTTRSGNFYISKRDIILSKTDPEDVWYTDKHLFYMMGNIPVGGWSIEQEELSLNLGTNIDRPLDYKFAKYLLSLGAVTTGVAK